MNSRQAVLTALVVLFLLVSAAPGRAAPAASFIVNNNADVPDATLDGICDIGNGDCTLRAAITEANATSGAVIHFSQPGSINYLLTLGTLTISSSMSIVGNGAALTIVDGDGSVTGSRVFTLSAGSSVVAMSGLTIQKGVSTQGGGIYNAARLSLANTLIISNTATAGSPNVAGGIYNTGSLTVTNSFIRNNSAPAVSFTGGGGGILAAGGNVTLINSTVDGNTTNNTGGGIDSDGAVVLLLNSTVSNNTANVGGGIFNGGVGSSALTVRQSGIYSNTSTGTFASDGGGGIENYNGTAALTNSTLYFNFANGSGGGLLNDNSGVASLYNVTAAWNYVDADHNGVGLGGGLANPGSGTLNFRNTLIARNWNINGCFACITADDCTGTLNSEDFNLIQTPGGCTISGATGSNVINTDPLLDPFVRNNGGPTLSEALMPGSPAIGAGNNGGCRDGLGALIPTDQRGFARPYPAGGPCDIGAYERAAFTWLPLIVR